VPREVLGIELTISPHVTIFLRLLPRTVTALSISRMGLAACGQAARSKTGAECLALGGQPLYLTTIAASIEQAHGPSIALWHKKIREEAPSLWCTGVLAGVLSFVLPVPLRSYEL
jgi:hypothetical protein